MSRVNYEKIRQDNIEEYGKGTRHLSYFADIYSTRTHFIFEVLQNAEDALARRSRTNRPGYVNFRLHHDKLEISHNGKPFDDRDIVGICGIGEGTKPDDYTQIGKFGIGFKSVYAYSFFPQIHSGNEHFEIRRFVEPYEIEAPASTKTLIVLPFDQPEKRPEWAFRENVNADIAEAEISQAINKLNIRTLLFLRHIEKIEWLLTNGEQGFLSKKTKQENPTHDWRIVEVSDHRGMHEQWHIFMRTITVKDGDKKHQATIEVAFLLDQNKNVIKASDTELVISFPTEKKTELGFLIQAPFKATKSRDNIKIDDSANHQMIRAAAQLAADSLAILRDTDRLAVASYNALPLDEEDFPEDNFFHPVYEQIREALRTQSLLPAHGGSYAKADEAKLARGKGLVDLFSPRQLGALFGKGKIVWLDASITSDAFPEFHKYLRDLVDRIEVTPESLFPKLTTGYLSKQSLAWLIRFIQYAEEGAKVLKRVPFIRLQSGEHVALPENSNITPTAWFAPNESEELDLSAFPLVHARLAANETVRAFLAKEGIREIDAVDKVVKSILPKYENTPRFNLSDYQNDLHQIAKAYTGNDEIKKKLENQLKNVAWLACVQAGDEAGDEIFWKKPNLYGDLFAKPKDLKLSFSELDGSKIYFLHPLFMSQFELYPSFKQYLDKNCIRDLNTTAIVEKVILPKYKDGNRSFDKPEYLKDLTWIVKAHCLPHYLHPPGLKQNPWLACVHASGNMPDKIIWKRPNVSERDSTIFERSSDYEIWFAGSQHVNAYFLHPTIEGELAEKINSLSNSIKELSKNIEKSASTKQVYSIRPIGYKQLLHGFDPDAKIIGLQEAFSDWNIRKSIILWKILLQTPKIICGETKFARYKYQIESAEKSLEYTEVGKLCRENSWLPDKKGGWSKPCELLLSNLPDEFETDSINAKEVAEKLGMKKPETEKAAEELSKGNPRIKELLEWLVSASEDDLDKVEKLKPKIVPPQIPSSFKEGLGNLFRPQHGSISANNTDHLNFPINNPERYQDKANQEVKGKVTLHQTTPQVVRFSPVRESSSNQEARNFLYQQYQGRCQINGNTFPKATTNANGDVLNYFEACSLLPYTNAEYLNDIGNMLCVSADTMAKLKHASFEWLDDLDGIIENFKSRQPDEIKNVKAKIKLAGYECEITWSERHFARLVALYDVCDS